MRDLVRADVGRILRRPVIWIMLIISLAIAVAGTYFTVGTPGNYPGFSFMSNSLVYYDLCLIILGATVLITCYGDDFKAMSIIGVIGGGLTREKTVFAKFLDTLIVLTLLDSIVIIGLLALSVPMQCIMSGTELSQFLAYVLCSFAGTLVCMTMSSIIMYVSGKLPITVFTYLVLYVIGILLSVVASAFSFPLGQYIFDTFYYTGLQLQAFSAFVLGSPLEGTALLLAMIILYIGGSLGLIILLFGKKELEL